MTGESSYEPDGQAPDDPLARRLAEARPVPSAAFRGDLGRRLAAEDPGFGPRPPDLWGHVSLLSLGAVILLAVGALQAAGAL